MKSPLETLRDICDEVIKDPKLAPHDGKTYCNFAICRVCFEYGIDLYDPQTSEPYLANGIVKIMSKSWLPVSGEVANQLANEGKLVIAGKYGDPHGHISTVYPGAMVWSNKWKKEAPVLANVGARNGIMGANWAFKDEPAYFVAPTEEV